MPAGGLRGAATATQSVHTQGVMHIESVGRSDSKQQVKSQGKDGRVRSQGSTWKEDKLKQQQTMDMQSLKNREHAADVKQKQRAQAADDKQQVASRPRLRHRARCCDT